MKYCVEPSKACTLSRTSKEFWPRTFQIFFIFCVVTLFTKVRWTVNTSLESEACNFRVFVWCCILYLLFVCCFVHKIKPLFFSFEMYYICHCEAFYRLLCGKAVDYIDAYLSLNSWYHISLLLFVWSSINKTYYLCITEFTFTFRLHIYCQVLIINKIQI